MNDRAMSKLDWSLIVLGWHGSMTSNALDALSLESALSRSDSEREGNPDYNL